LFIIYFLYKYIWFWKGLLPHKVFSGKYKYIKYKYKEVKLLPVKRESLSWVIILTLMGFLTFFIPVGQLYADEDINISHRIDRTDFPIIRLQSRAVEGEAVWLAEARLRDLGYNINPDGIYDQETADVVKTFQLASGLLANGEINKDVWEALMYGGDSQTCLSQEDEKKARHVRIEIDVAKHRLTLFENGKAIKSFPVGVGKSSTPTPLGEWKVINKGVNWGNGFGTRWMGLNVPWGIYGIHGTNKPSSIGASQSHGCIRMQNRDVEILYPLVPLGTRVKITENGKMFPSNFKAVKLQKRSSGQNVVYLQSRLKELGIILDNADGRFGEMTELALKYFQVWNGLEPTGIADTETYRALGMIK